MSISSSFDYIIIGAGAAGFQLAIKMSRDPFFDDKSILVLDKFRKRGDDHTWSFWEEQDSIWEPLVTKSWSTGRFITEDEEVELKLPPYSYKSIKSDVFYQLGHETIEKSKNFSFKAEAVRKVESNKVFTEKSTYSASHLFDSRIPPAYHKNESKYHSLKQHFRGWVVEFETAPFNEEEFVMMDYRIKWNNSCSFMYILPFDQKKALFEYTLFNQTLLHEITYEKLIKKYIERFYPGNYKILEKEQGNIPMSDYPFEKHNTHFLTKIGTGGGWVRPSSGYSFKNADRFTDKLIENLKAQRKPSKGLMNRKHRLYDRIFLYVLKTCNKEGELLFRKICTEHDIRKVFRFLDGVSTLWEDMSIIISYCDWKFIVALWKSRA